MKLIKFSKGEPQESLTFGLLNVVLEFYRDFKWRKKCKKLIKRLRSQLVIQKNRRESIIRQAEADIAQLQNYGSQKTAFARDKQLYKDQCILYAYLQIEDFCDCIYLNLLTKHSKMSDEVTEAISSLVFAASRCGELLELSNIRALIRKRFGNEFVKVNVELLPGNCVNSKLIYNLGKKIRLKKEKPRRPNRVDTEFDKTFSRKSSGHEKHDDSSNLGCEDNRRINNNKGEVQESKVRNIFNKIGSKFYSFNSTHLATICADSKNSSRRKEDSFREVEASKSRLNYVHPKLPDYDDLVTTFTKYKKDRLTKSDSRNKAFSKWMRL